MMTRPRPMSTTKRFEMASMRRTEGLVLANRNYTSRRRASWGGRRRAHPAMGRPGESATFRQSGEVGV